MATSKGYVFVGSDRVIAGTGNYVYIVLEASSISAYLEGAASGTGTSDNIAAFLQGQEDVDSSILAFIKGQDSSLSNIEAYIEGQVGTAISDSISSFLSGLDTHSGNIEAFIIGEDTAQASIEVYLFGKVVVGVLTGSTSAFIEGTGSWPFSEDFTGDDSDPWSSTNWFTETS